MDMRWHLLFTAILLAFVARSQQTAKTLETSTGDFDYLLYVPHDYDDEKSYPLMFFLHGAGERGDDINLVKVHGPPKYADQGSRFDYLIVSPQNKPNTRWASKEYLGNLNELYSHVVENYNINTSRVYLTGLSMGGQGTWEWAKDSPEKFAAIAPICGFSNKNNIENLVSIPIWVFHGAKDRVVDIKESETMVAWLKELGADVKFTVYPEANHDSWTETYENPEFYKWILSHTKN